MIWKKDIKSINLKKISERKEICRKRNNTKNIKNNFQKWKKGISQIKRIH
jgi:hypothetical protein